MNRRASLRPASLRPASLRPASLYADDLCSSIRSHFKKQSSTLAQSGECKKPVNPCAGWGFVALQ